MRASDLEEIVDNLWNVSERLNDEGHDECAKQVMACASKLGYLILRELNEMRFSLSEDIHNDWKMTSKEMYEEFERQYKAVAPDLESSYPDEFKKAIEDGIRAWQEKFIETHYGKDETD